MSYKRESGFRRFLRKLLTARADAGREIYGSVAYPPPLHIEHGPANPRRKPKRR